MNIDKLTYSAYCGTANNNISFNRGYNSNVDTYIVKIYINKKIVSTDLTIKNLYFFVYS